MLEDLVAACKPRRMTVEIACNPRGGLASVVKASYAAAHSRAGGRRKK